MTAQILDELVRGILAVLSTNVKEIILYGSFARHTETPDSDVDIAVLVKNDISSYDEDRLSDFIVDMNLKYDTVFSVIDIRYDHFMTWVNSMPFYKNVDQEGVKLWKAA